MALNGFVGVGTLEGLQGEAATERHGQGAPLVSFAS
jgi:hypothetical protein